LAIVLYEKCSSSQGTNIVLDLSGRTAIVTGAASGIGAAVCRLFQASGAQVLPVDLKGEGMFKADVGTKAGNQAMVQAAVEQFGRLDTLVLNAGLFRVSSVVEQREEDWDFLMNVMAKGPMLAMQAAWPYLTARPGGRVVITASIGALKGFPNVGAYNSAKHAVVGLMKCAALEGAPYGLLVNAVAPGAVRTPMNDAAIAEAMAEGLSREEAEREVASYQTIHRLIEPEEIAAMIGFLVGPGGSAITGTVVSVDLGAAMI
jgi:3-hydroxybutyrate dehydrogenase